MMKLFWKRTDLAIGGSDLTMYVARYYVCGKRKPIQNACWSFRI